MQQSTDPPASELQNEEESGGTLSPSAYIAQRPQIKSLQELYCWGERSVWVESSDSSNGAFEFKNSYACYIDGNEVAYYGMTAVRQSELTPEILNECLEWIPDEELYPAKPLDQEITMFKLPSTNGFHVKQLLTSWNEMWRGTDWLPKLFLGEIEAFELLRQNPHPNFIRYHGCTVNRRDRIVGIVMDRHEKTLAQYLDDKHESCNFDPNSCFEEIESAVKHLHSLGWAHNDLNPNNIMLDKQRRPVLIDFGSCKPFGSRLQELGTDGWIDEKKKHFHSEKEHDEYALKKIFDWMLENTTASQLAVK